jgi:hypothetical protein
VRKSPFQTQKKEPSQPPENKPTLQESRKTYRSSQMAKKKGIYLLKRLLAWRHRKKLNYDDARQRSSLIFQAT